MKSKLEYIWLDGYKPTQSLRSKTLVSQILVVSSKIARCGHLTVALPNRPTAVILTAYSNRLWYS